MSVETYFAPAERDSAESLQEQKKQIMEKFFIIKILDTIPTTVMVLNKQRQAVFCNRSLIEYLGIPKEDDLTGLRPGEILNCTNSKLNSGGCGTSQFCKYCEAVLAILDCIKGQAVTRECKINTDTKSGHEFITLRVTAIPLIVDDSEYVCFSIDNITNEKKLNLLEHLFIHDISNTVTIIQCITDLLQFAENNSDVEELLSNLATTTQSLTDEIQMHRQILLAEHNELTPVVKSINSCVDFLEEMKMSFKIHNLCKNKNIIIARDSVYIEIFTDQTILKRVIGNMMKNALEASSDGETIVIGSKYPEENQVMFYVKNNAVMSEEVKSQLFKQSFSTKGVNRGLGTFSIRLLTEKYLKGSVNYISDEEHGTIFSIKMPVNINK